MNSEQQQRIEQIRERLLAHRVEASKYLNHEWAKGNALHYYEAPDDVDLLLSVINEQEAGCSLCGGPHDFDTSIPSVVWNAVIRARNLPDFLCATCIVREFVRAGQGFTAELWNEEFKGVPIEVIVNGQNAQDASLVQEENNALRAELRDSAEAIVNEAGKVAQLMEAAAEQMRSACVEKVKSIMRERLSQSAPDSEDHVYDQAVAFVLTSVASELESVSIQQQETSK